MENPAVTYQTEILNEPFVLEEKRFEKTVIVETYASNKLVSKTKYGLATKSFIFDQLDQNGKLNLDYCYIKDFSITEYKKSKGIAELDYLDLINFSAQNAFFDCTLRTDFSYIHFKGGINLNESVFAHGHVSFFKCKISDGTTEFKNVAFGNGEISFQYTKFGEGDVLFGSSKFYGGVVSFVNANFSNGKVNFNNVNFYNSKVKFHFSKFGDGDIGFQKAKFGDRTVDFRTVEFGSGKVDFRRAVFGDCYVTFDESELKSGRFNFRYVRCNKSELSFKDMNFGSAQVMFENVDFGSGEISFLGSTAEKISFKGSKINAYLDLRVGKANTIILSDTVIRDIVDLKPTDNEVHIHSLYLNGMRNLGRLIIDWKLNKIKDLIINQTETTYNQKSIQFNTLKENFNHNGQYYDEDQAYIYFKRFELISDFNLVRKEGGLNYLKLPGQGFRWLIFDKMGLYATSPFRVLLSMLITYILFSISYLIIPIFKLGNIINSVGATDGLNYLQTCFYHSAITFLTIGYGDYYPTGLSRGISVIEGWIGLFLMSYFTVAFVRKILR